MLPVTHQEPGKHKALALALAMHALLGALLFFGVQWKRSAPDVVEVELWSARPSLPPPAPVEPPPVPTPPEPKPVPKEIPPEPKPAVKPDIVTKVEKKQPPPEPKKPEPPKPVPPTPKPPEPKPAPDFRDMIKAEENQRKAETARATAAANAESELRAAANKRGLASWGDKIRAKIRGNVTLPPNIQGNPEIIIELNLLPTGEVLQPIKIKKSSGNPGLDAAIERAILKSSPLPKPDDPSVFQRTVEIKYRPIEE